MPRSRMPVRLFLLLLLGGNVAAAAPGKLEEPPAPEASQAVQVLLDRVRLLANKQATEALDLADQAFVAATSAEDVPGEALAQTVRARALEALARTADAIAAWRDAAAAWGRAGDGPGQIDALCSEAILLLRQQAELAAPRLERAIALARKEVRRPLSTIVSLNSAGQRMSSLGRLTEAKSLAEAALDLAEKHAPDSLDFAVCLTNVGSVTLIQGDLGAARNHYLRALEIAEKHAPDSIDVAAILNNLGSVARDPGDLATARDYFVRALEIQEKHAPGSLHVAMTLNNLGNVAHKLGDLGAARYHFVRSLEIREKQAPGSPDVAGSFFNLGTVAFYQDDLAAARDYYSHALEIWERIAPGSLGVAQILNNLGNVARKEGDLAAARGYYFRALEIWAAHDPGSPAVASSLVGLGNVAGDQGDLATARDYFVRALEIQEEHAPGSLDVAGILNNLGNLAWSQGDNLAARYHFVRSLEIREKQAPGSLDVAGSFVNLGNVARRQDEYAMAHDYYSHALEIWERIAPGSLGVAGILNNLGNVAQDQGDLVVARNSCLRALEIHEKHAPGSAGMANILESLGSVAREQGDVAAARYAFVRSLEIREKQAPGSLGVADSLHKLGLAARDQGEIETALGYFEQSWDIVRRQRRAVGGDEARQAFGTAYTSYSWNLADVQLVLGRITEAFRVHEESRAQTLLDILAERGLAEQVAEPGLWRAYLDSESAFHSAGQRLARAVEEEGRLEQVVRSASADPTAAQAQNQELASAHAGRERALSEYTRARLEMEAWLVTVKRSVPELDPEALTPEQARALLPSGALFIAFSVGEKTTSVFLVTSDLSQAIQAYTVQIGQKELVQEVNKLRERLQVRPLGPGAVVARHEEETIGTSRGLFGRLFPASAQAVIESSKRMMISPDGPLWELPFAALVTNSSGAPRWLGLSKPLAYELSLDVYALGRRRATPSATEATLQALIVGDPLFIRVPDKTPTAAGRSEAVAPQAEVRGERAYLFEDGQVPAALPGTRDEAQRVGQLYGVQPLLGEASTEPAVRSRIGTARVVHLATHGYFHPRLAMSSGVLLTPPGRIETGKTNDDGALQAWEFGRSLPLRAEVVVLSACETGRGETLRGEGLVGLSWGLQAAGARSVVATHWKVADRSTADLMVGFHRRLRSGLAKDEALREAQADVQANAATRHPYYWAAFFLTGDPDRLQWEKR